MNDKNDPPRNLEKVYHFFLTEKTASNQDPETTTGTTSSNETAPITTSSVPQNNVEYDLLQSTVAQLYVLRNSCKGMCYTHNPDEDNIWLEGAESILQDAITNLIRTLRFLDNSTE
jgi:hypothetical protein